MTAMYSRFEISEEGTYLLSVSDGPEDVGIWKTVDGTGHALKLRQECACGVA